MLPRLGNGVTLPMRRCQFVLLTGVTELSQINFGSSFNQANDITLTDDYETLCGITKEELLTIFDEQIKKLTKKYSVSFDEVLEMLNRKYGGYHFSSNMTYLYNPDSILNAFRHQKIDNYWDKNSTTNYTKRIISLSKVDINDYRGKYYDPLQFISRKADTERPLPIIYQSGYFTIKDIERIGFHLLYKLEYPNEEAKEALSLLRLKLSEKAK